MDRREFLALTAGLVLPRRGGKRRARRVLVVGAGLAGLAAADELSRAGMDVTVLEARAEPGGRVRTLRAPFADGLYAEAGALLVPETHHLVRAYVARFDLTLIPVVPRPGGELYQVRGRRLRVADGVEPAWPFDLTAAERALGLAGLWQRYVVSALDEIGDPASPGWPSPSLARYDAMTMGDFLRGRGASPDAVALLALGYLDLGGDGVETYSALSMLRDVALRRGNRRYAMIAGGNDRLPVAMAAGLGARVEYRTTVVRVEPGAGGAAVVAERDGAPVRLTADDLICALPPRVLASIEVAPDFSPARRAALRALASTSVTRVLVQTRTRVWERLGQPGSAVTDLATKWVWDATAAQPGRRGILDAHLGGAAARRLGALGDAERATRVLADLDRVYPGVRDEVEASVAVDWDADPHARGAYAWFRPGQLPSVTRVLAAPEGRVHFAGEHLAAASGWMEGALASGVRAAQAVLARASPG
jgi:monoamine oxidase